MHASLDRMLNVVFSSPYFRELGNDNTKLNWLTMQKCLAAYTFEKLDKNWQIFLGACLYSADIRDINLQAYPPIAAGLTEKQIKIINSRLKKGSITASELITDEDIASLPSTEKKIINQEQFPEVDFLKSDDFYQIGTIGDTTLLLVGKEQGSKAPIVAKSYESARDSEELFAVPLYALLNSQEPINITEDINQDT